jgi:signal peptidase I
VSRKGSYLRELPVLVTVALVVSILIKSFLVQFFYIPSGSMENTLQIADRVAVNRVPFLSQTVHRGDVIVFRDPAGWLPSAQSAGENVVIAKVKEVFVAVGVLPNPAKQYLVKRVIGLPGDHIVCCDKNKSLIINGTPVSEPYVYVGNSPSDMKFDIKVAAGKYWVMGDHRGASADSRYHQDDINKGQVPTDRITGRVVGIIWPIKHLKVIPSVNVLK